MTPYLGFISGANVFCGLYMIMCAKKILSFNKSFLFFYIPVCTINNLNSRVKILIVNSKRLFNLRLVSCRFNHYSVFIYLNSCAFAFRFLLILNHNLGLRFLSLFWLLLYRRNVFNLYWCCKT